MLTTINIFYLDSCPEKAAQDQCDKHVVKMVLETAQLLSNVQHTLNGPVKDEVYKLTHKNNPLAIWARSSKENYEWLCLHGMALCREYTYRYGKIHKSQEKIQKCLDNPPVLCYNGFTEPTQVLSDELKSESSVDAYRACYYITKYKGIYGDSIQMKWTKREKPDWWPED